ncbi:MAG: hypothetical protein GY943_19885 [Chloroflexi bacterium]|nr:hypothetical protein [Chloroflexota bacterium]
MTFTQKFVMTYLPKSWSTAIRAESENWMLHCPTCGSVRSVWDAGGIRYKAASVSKRVHVWCNSCGRPRNMSLEKE